MTFWESTMFPLGSSAPGEARPATESSKIQAPPPKDWGLLESWLSFPGCTPSSACNTACCVRPAVLGPDKHERVSSQSLAQGRWVPSNGAPVRSVPLHSDSSFDNLSLLPEAMPIGMVSRNPSSENLHIHEVPKLTRLRLAKHTGGHEFDITFTQEEWKALSFDERAEAHSLLELQSIAKQEKDSPSIIDRVNAARTASLSKDLYFQARDQNKQARERMKRLGEHLIEKKNAYDQLAKQYPWIAGRTGSDRNIKLGSEIMTQMDKLRSDIAELKSKTEYHRRDAEKWRCACCLYRKPKVTGSKGWCLNTSTRKYEFQCNAKGPSNEGRGSSRTIGRAEETFNN